ncbi:uncharacterized protein [Arachis hypogaea]|uniref:uncharacterized protein n=1 Tax=Arachis hypogaea TaxID=3818 RepID=UPI000DED2E9F|nr:putative uncharacterized protein DDB_G0285119 [Arachis hypogaea]XP_025663102.1 putative uncharacterized protein DDB_G0285119 [Arachis hypogaea]
MGNCLVLHHHENNMVRVMKSDGKILEFKAPIKVHQVLAQFSGYHAISNSLQSIHHLHPNTKLLKGQIFYLVPMSPSLSPSPKSSSKKKKKVRFAEQEVVVEGKGAKENINTNDDDNNNNNNGVVRIKIVISKQQLHDMMMQKGEIISVDELLSLVDHGENSNGEECDDDNNNNDGSIGWKPCLESIPELC